MSNQSILEQLTAIFAKVFMDDSIVISPSTSAADVIGWDSLSHVRLISEVEKHFDFQFDIDDIVSMKNVGDMISIINKNI